MKKIERIHIRIDPETKSAFDGACQKAGVIQAAVIRDLMTAATLYMARHGKWDNPMLVADTHEAESAVLRILGPVTTAPGGKEVIEAIIDRVIARRHMMAAEARPTYGAEAGADQPHPARSAGVRVITPPPAPSAPVRPSKPVNVARTSPSKTKASPR